METLGQMTPLETQEMFSEACYQRLLFEAGMTALDMANKIGCFASERDALRIMDAGGFYVNGFRVTNPDEVMVPEQHVLPNKVTLVRVGKKNYHVVEWLV